jgi:D-alanyl-D-alanine carboxypeptidase
MKKVFWIGVALLVAVPSARAQRGNPVTSFAGKTPDEMIAAFMKEHDVAGMTLSIVQAPYVPRVVGYGVADSEHELLASPSTLWAIGEMTQAYTGIAVMQLVEEGKLSIDSHVCDVVPNLPSEWAAITLRQLLGHSSGLPDFTRQPALAATRDYSPSEVLASIRKLPLTFKPGTQVARSGTNFLLLGLAIEQASGMSYEEFVTKRQIEALGLTHTIFPSQLARIKRDDISRTGNAHTLFHSERIYIDPTEIAVGNDSRGAPVGPSTTTSSALAANDGLLASAGDISIWDVALAGEILVKKTENRELLYSGFRLVDGKVFPANCGWRFPAHKGFMDITGNAPGCSAYLSRFTDRSELVCVTLCCNKEGLDLTELARRIAGCFGTDLGPPVDPAVMTCLESCYPVDITMDRFESYVKSRGVGIAARVDHAAAASNAGLDLRPTQTLIFGNPAIGTPLMLNRQDAALDLPLRVAAWQDEKGSVWIGWRDPAEVARSHSIADVAASLAKMKTLIAGAAEQATSPY